MVRVQLTVLTYMYTTLELQSTKDEEPMVVGACDKINVLE